MGRAVHKQPCIVPLSPIPYRLSPPPLSSEDAGVASRSVVVRYVTSIPGETYPAPSQFTSHDPRMPPPHTPGVHHAVSTLSACVLGSASFLLIYFSPHSLLGSEIICFELSCFITTVLSPSALSLLPECSPESPKAILTSSPPPWPPLYQTTAYVELCANTILWTASGHLGSCTNSFWSLWS